MFKDAKDMYIRSSRKTNTSVANLSRSEFSAHSSPSYLIVEHSIKFEIIILQDYLYPF